MEFLWTKEVKTRDFPVLDGDIDTDVLIIGGGMAGVLCALKMQEAGVDYVLVEGRKIGGGITKGTTAVLSAQHDTLYQDMIQKFGKENARLYLQANLWALKRFAKLCETVSCDYEERPSIMYSLNNRAIMEQEVDAVRQLGFAAEFIRKTPLPFPVAGAVRYNGMAQFHPLKFLYGIAGDKNIYENTFVTKIKDTRAFTQKGVINAKKIIIATHYPFINSRGLYFAKLYQRRSFVIALENGPDLGCTIEDGAENGFYLRNYKDLLLVGGGDRRTGTKGGGFAEPRAFAKKYFPQAREKFAWANQDCVSLDGVPYIGRYSPALPDVYVASGFDLWGMTSSMISSEIIGNMILGRENPFAAAFAPNRNILTGQLFVNIGTTLLNLLTPTTKRCSHMGCALKWNPQEHSWDCPCHGSRFNEHGRIINNPAMRDGHVE